MGEKKKSLSLEAVLASNTSLTIWGTYKRNTQDEPRMLQT